MNTKKVMISILLIMLAVLVLVAVIIGAVNNFRIWKICALIENGHSEEAIQYIEKIPNVNRYSAPIWVRGALTMLFEQDIHLPLVSACRVGDIDVVLALLEHGANPNQFLDGNWSPIEAAIISGRETRLDIIKALVANGADVNLFGSRQSALFEELSALMYSRELTEEERALSKEVITFLLKNGATLIENDGNTMLHCLAYAGDLEMLDAFNTECRDFFNMQNERGKTPLMFAVSAGKKSAVEWLIANGADTGIVDSAGKSAYDYAVEEGYHEIAAILE